jgi:hypothetical protein
MGKKMRGMVQGAQELQFGNYQTCNSIKI